MAIKARARANAVNSIRYVIARSLSGDRDNNVAKTTELRGVVVAVCFCAIPVDTS